MPLPSVSFVIPCYNEEITLPAVLQTIRDTVAYDLPDRKVEIVVTDNGSTDNSVKIARAHGARVTTCKEKGYGANLLNGFKAAKNDIIVFADADNSYNFAEAPALIARLEEGYDFVVGSRYRGRIAKGSMPTLHRYLGTPVLNLFINALYGGRNHISDCNSGFRCFYRRLLPTLALRSPGMEFASEMLVSALRRKLRLSEVPITLVPDGRTRPPSLQTWNDGMRHLLQIFSSAPHVFFITGIALWAPSMAVILISTFAGTIQIFGANIFGIHTALVAIGTIMIALQVWSVGLYISTAAKDTLVSKIYHRLATIAENKLFLILVSFLTLTLASTAWVLYQWSINNYRLLAIERELVLLTALIVTFFSFVASLITVRLMRRSR